MFRKTPIVLAILALGTSLNLAHATTPWYTPISIDQNQYGEMTLPSQFIQVRPADSLTDTNVSIEGGDAVAVTHSAHSQSYFNGFDSLSVHSSNADAVHFNSGNFAFGLKLKESVDNAGKPEDTAEFDKLNKVTIVSENGSAIVGRTVDDKASSDTGEFYIVAQNVRIESRSRNHAAIDLEGVSQNGTVNFDNSILHILRYDETSWVREDEHGWNGQYTKNEKGKDEPVIDYALAKKYGLCSEDKMQNLEVVGKRDAIRLVNGSSMSVAAGKVNIQGNVYLNNGADLSLGFTTNGLTDVPLAHTSWDEDKQKFVLDEIPEPGYYELINRVRIRAKQAPSDDSANKAAIHVEGGSAFCTAANRVFIYGAKLDTEQDQNHHPGGKHRPVDKFFKDVHGHFGGKFQDCDTWKDDFFDEDNERVTRYSDAIYLKTDQSSKLQYVYDEQGSLKEAAIPSIVSIWGEKELQIHGDIVLDFADHYSGSLLYIGAADTAKVIINGDIHVYNDENGDYENTIKLDLHAGHLFVGSIIDHTQEAAPKPAMLRMMRAQPQTAATDTPTNRGTHLTLNNNHSTILTGESVISQLTSAGSSILNLADNAALAAEQKSSVTIKQLNLNGDTAFYTMDVTPAQFRIENMTVGSASTYGLRRTAAPAPTLDFVVEDMTGKTKEEAAALVAFGAGDEDASANINPGYKVKQLDSSSGGERTVTVGAGRVTSANITEHQETNTTVAKAINDVAGLSVLAWRAQMNDVNKRLGDLRTYQGNHGAWARLYGGEAKFGDLGLKSEYTALQIGADTKLAGNWYLGVTAGYTDGNGTLDNGSTDDTSYSFGVYGGWMGDDGQFVDIIVKEANYKTDFDLRYTTGEASSGGFDLWGTSVCAEYGWRLNLNERLWIEPQAEVTYGYMNDVSYTYSGNVKATQEATESLVGRLGIALGTTGAKGSAYVKASVAHDWMGETEISMSNGLESMKEDLGGTWGELSVGGTYNFDNGWAVYGELQSAKGSKMKTPLQYNIGARYVF